MYDRGDTLFWRQAGELPGVIESGMPRRNGQRKPGTTRAGVASVSSCQQTAEKGAVDRPEDWLLTKLKDRRILTLGWRSLCRKASRRLLRGGAVARANALKSERPMKTSPSNSTAINRIALLLGLAVVLGTSVSVGHADTIVEYVANLTGPGESPPNPSPGTGFADVTIDETTNMMHVVVSFTGLEGTNDCLTHPLLHRCRWYGDGRDSYHHADIHGISLGCHVWELRSHF
jgi:hypothetical protein